MAHGVRTIIFVVAVTIAVVAAPSTASADLGDLLGIITGGSGGSPPQSGSPQPGTQPRPTAPAAPAPQSQPVQPQSKLLAPDSRCPGQTDTKLGAAARSKAMACMLSYARVAKGRPALRRFKPLQTSATRKAQDVRRCQKLSHEACGRDTWYWVQRVGFFKGRWAIGEVLADGAGAEGTVRGTIRLWLGSPPHRAVLFHPGFNLLGVGSVRGRFHGTRHVTIWAAQLGYHHPLH